jgi:hypothetical protein
MFISYPVGNESPTNALLFLVLITISNAPKRALLYYLLCLMPDDFTRQWRVLHFNELNCFYHGISRYYTDFLYLSIVGTQIA